MWESENTAFQISREGELVKKFWSSMLANGAQIGRFLGDRKSALEKELVDEELALPETSAGKYISDELANIKKHFEIELEELKKDMKGALSEKNILLAKILEDERQEYLHKIQ
jgi:hypothetical protein